MTATDEKGKRGNAPAETQQNRTEERPAGNGPKPAVSQPPSGFLSVRRSTIYIAASVVLWLTQGLGMNFVAVNTNQIQGSLGATLTETNWLTAAYMAPNVSLTLLLIKVRTQFGLRRFCEVSLCIFVAASLLHLFVYDFWSALPVRFLAGAAASPVSTIGFLYMLEAFPPAKKMTWGLSLALTCSGAMPTVARIISPSLLDLGQWQQLYMMEIGLALMSLAIVYLLPLAPVPHAKVLHWRDFVTYPLVAIGFGLVAIVLVLGRNYWWFEAQWIGVCLAIAALSIGLAAAVEIRRHTPLIDIKWLTSPDIVRFTLTLLTFRIVLSEQTAGAIGLFQILGLLNEHSRLLQGVVLLGSLLGGFACGVFVKLERVTAFHCLALACIAAGAYMDSYATNLTRPHDMYFSQALIAFGSGLFLPPALLAGLTKTLKQSPNLITSFVVVFLFTQSVGGLIGSALFGSFVTLREKFHSSYLVEQVVLSDPIVADRVRQLSAAYGRVLTDQQLLNAEGLALLSQQVTREANVLAYNDAFLAIAVISVTALAAMIVSGAYGYVRNRLSIARVASA